jgi:hypothetical protein
MRRLVFARLELPVLATAPAICVCGETSVFCG